MRIVTEMGAGRRAQGTGRRHIENPQVPCALRPVPCFVPYALSPAPFMIEIHGNS